jgi:hypothetical protein
LHSEQPQGFFFSFCQNDCAFSVINDILTGMLTR